MKLLVRRLIYMLFSIISILFGLLALFSDVFWLHDSVSEISITEITQETVLLAIILLFFHQAWCQAQQRGAMVLIGGFFTCMLIREMDFAFDWIRHGSWIIAALIVAVGCCLFALRTPHRTLAALVNYLYHPGYGMMLSGLLCVLVFSRLFGMHIFWQELLMEGYHRVVKNMVEEGSELFGYILCLQATIWYKVAPRNESVRLG